MNELIKKYPLKLSELFFCLFFVSLLFAKGIGLYDGQTLFKLFLLTALCGWVGKMLLTEYTRKELILCAGLTLLGGIIYLNAHEKGALFCLLLLCALKDMNVKRVFQVGLTTWIISFGGLFLLTSLHIIDSPFKVHDKLGLGRIIRWSLGYAHPNVLHISCLTLVCFIVYLLQDKFKVRSFLVLMLLNLYVFMYSLSSTGFLAVSALLVLSLYWSYRKKFCKAEQVLIQFCLPVFILLSLAAPLVLKGEAFELVNKIVNHRLVLSQWFLQNQPVKLFGVDTGELVTSLRTMDNSYVFAWITYGLLFFVLMMAGYFMLIYKKTKEQDGVSLCLILACLLAGVTEPFLFNTSFKNITLIFMGAMLFEGKKYEKKKLGEEKKLRLLSGYDRTLMIRFPDFAAIGKEIGKAAAGYRLKMIITAAFLGIAAGAATFCLAEMPQRYIMPRTAFEHTDDIEETYYLTSAEDLPQPGDVVMGYVNEATDMVPFSGNIARVERFRNTVSAGVVTAFLVYGLGSVTLWIRERKTKGA